MCPGGKMCCLSLWNVHFDDLPPLVANWGKGVTSPQGLQVPLFSRYHCSGICKTALRRLSKLIWLKIILHFWHFSSVMWFAALTQSCFITDLRRWQWVVAVTGGWAAREVWCQVCWQSCLSQKANLAMGLVLMQHFPGPGTGYNSGLVKSGVPLVMNN